MRDESVIGAQRDDVDGMGAGNSFLASRLPSGIAVWVGKSERGMHWARAAARRRPRRGVQCSAWVVGNCLLL